MNSNLIIIGKILNTHGIKGTLKVQPITGDINRFSYLKYVVIDENRIDVKKCEIRKDLVYMDLLGYEDINKVLKFKGKYIYVYPEDRMKLREGEYFQDDIIGLKCFDMEGNYLGKVKSIIENPVHDIYEVLTEDGKSSFVPAISQFVKEINLENGITINPIKGMF